MHMSLHSNGINMPSYTRHIVHVMPRLYIFFAEYTYSLALAIQYVCSHGLRNLAEYDTNAAGKQYI